MKKQKTLLDHFIVDYIDIFRLSVNLKAFQVKKSLNRKNDKLFSIGSNIPVNEIFFLKQNFEIFF